MAPGNKRGNKARRAAKEPAAQSADASTKPDSDAEEEANEEAPPLNRAERRLAAKRKAGRNAPTRATPHGMSSSTNTMRGQGVKGPGGSKKGTNTRRSG